jgi:hypothetical protein
MSAVAGDAVLRAPERERRRGQGEMLLTERLKSNYRAIAQRSKSDGTVVFKLLLWLHKVINKRLQSDSKAIAKQLYGICKAKAQENGK